jgi:cellulose synthase/poly-beta-1,6-N-acetylglucosamine synthase-like glycosyltransferase
VPGKRGRGVPLLKSSNGSLFSVCHKGIRLMHRLFSILHISRYLLYTFYFLSVFLALLGVTCNSVLIYLRADLAQSPITKLAGVRRNNNKTYKIQNKAVYIIIIIIIIIILIMV